MPLSCLLPKSPVGSVDIRFPCFSNLPSLFSFAVPAKTSKLESCLCVLSEESRAEALFLLSSISAVLASLSLLPAVSVWSCGTIWCPLSSVILDHIPGHVGRKDICKAQLEAKIDADFLQEGFFTGVLQCSWVKIRRTQAWNTCNSGSKLKVRGSVRQFRNVCHANLITRVQPQNP